MMIVEIWALQCEEEILNYLVLGIKGSDYDDYFGTLSRFFPCWSEHLIYVYRHAYISSPGGFAHSFILHSISQIFFYCIYSYYTVYIWLCIFFNVAVSIFFPLSYIS